MSPTPRSEAGAAASGAEVGGRRIDLHIGVEKTGTSTIQAACQAGRDVLASQGVLYPRAVGGRSHFDLAVVGRDDDAVDDVRLFRGLTTPERLSRFRAEKRDELAAEVQEAGLPRVLLSNEHCSSRLRSEAEVERLVVWLRDAVGTDDVHVHVYLRRQDGMLESRFSTAARAGAATELSLPGPAQMPIYDFASMLDRWARVLGEDRIHPRVFSRSALVDGDVVADLAAQLRIEPPPPPPSGDANTAYDAAVQRFAVLLNEHVPRMAASGGREPLHRLVVEALDRVEPRGSPARLDPADAAAFMASLEPGNDAVAARWFDGSPLFEERRPPQRPTPVLDVERAVELGAHVLRHVTDVLGSRHTAEAATARARIAALEEQLERRSTDS